MGVMPANSNNSKRDGGSDVTINANSHCNTVSTEDGAIIVFEKSNNGNSNGHTSIRGRTLRTHQASLPNNGFDAEFEVAWRAWRATRCPSSWTGNRKLLADNHQAATVIC